MFQKLRGGEGRVLDPSTQPNLLSFLDRSDFLPTSPMQRQAVHNELAGADTKPGVCPKSRWVTRKFV